MVRFRLALRLRFRLELGLRFRLRLRLRLGLRLRQPKKLVPILVSVHRPGS